MDVNLHKAMAADSCQSSNQKPAINLLANILEGDIRRHKPVNIACRDGCSLKASPPADIPLSDAEVPSLSLADVGIIQVTDKNSLYQQF